MDEPDTRIGGDSEMEPSDQPTEGDATGGPMWWRFAWADLTPADDEAMGRQATLFAEFARELRAIVRGVHPYTKSATE